MDAQHEAIPRVGHSHVFLGEGHEHSEKRSWAVIWLCGTMMAIEIVGGLLFGSIALVADGLHMSTHAGALLLAALAYRYARTHASDARFTFGTGKLGDLAGFTSAIVLAMIALLIGYDSIGRLLSPVPIHFAEAIPIAGLGLLVNIGSVWLLGGGGHHHGHGHGHGHDHGGHTHDEEHRVETGSGPLLLGIFEAGVPPVFRLRALDGASLAGVRATVETIRPDGTRELFEMTDHGGYLQSVRDIPEPHQFTAELRLNGNTSRTAFEEHSHDASAHRDNNMRAALVHVAADAAVSLLVIVGLLLARSFGWLWMDPLAGMIGACVIASWAYGLIRDTGAILLDMNPDRRVTEAVRQAVEETGARLTDLHVWRLGPGHLGAVLSVASAEPREPAFYRERLARFGSLSHVTIEVERMA